LIFFSSEAAMTLKINFKLVSGGQQPFTLEVEESGSVEDVRLLVAQNCSAPTEQCRLICKGKILKDGESLASHGLKSGDTIIVSKRHFLIFFP
jgi:hypothetical protein